MPSTFSAPVSSNISSSNNVSTASMPANLSSANNGSVVTVGGGPSGGGAIIVHNDNISLSSSKTNASSSGYGGSSNLANSMISSAVSTANGIQPSKPSNNALADHKFNANNTSFSDVENGMRYFYF